MKGLKTIIRVIIFLIIGITIFLAISPVFIPKTINEKKGFYRSVIQGFYEEPKNSLDVVFIGDSSIYRDISPIKMWEQYGFTSYDFASPAQKIWDSYYCIKEVLRYQKPKVIVLHIDAAFTPYAMNQFNKRHLYDNIEYSINKINAILDPVQNNKDETLSLLFPILRFHSRWSELDDEDFEYAYKKMYQPFKGYLLAKGRKKYTGDNQYMKNMNKYSELEEKVTKYLLKIKNICSENNIQLLLLETPSPKTWNQIKHEKIDNWANENKVQFLDLNTCIEKVGIDWEKDTHDGGEHLNIYGAEKVSMYLGGYLKEYYQLLDHRNEKEYIKWTEDAKEYDKKVKSIKR